MARTFLSARLPLPYFDDETGGGGGGGTAPPAAPPTATPAAAPPAAPAVPTAEPKMFSAEYVHEVRSEAAEWRTKYRGLEEAYKGLGSPDEIKNQLAQRDGTIREHKVNGKLSEVFTKHSAIPDLTRALLQTDPAFSKLNPDDPEFDKTVDSMVKVAVDKHPALKAGQAPPTPPAPPRSGLPISGGGQPAPTQLTRENLKAMTPEQIADAVRKGELDQVLGRAPK